MYFYNERGNALYWGDPVYRANIYNRSDFYVIFMQRRNVNIELTYSLHFLESRVYNEQMLKVIVNLNSL
jgi:outer membrane protein assembly factor BamE (lipoprotein component of BamABCDE complex)